MKKVVFTAFCFFAGIVGIEMYENYKIGKALQAMPKGDSDDHPMFV